jgi:hypothetical protein
MTDTAARLCTQEELDEMGRTGLELVHEAIDAGDQEELARVVGDVFAARAGFAAVYTGWMGAMLQFLFERRGSEGLTGALDPEGWLAIAGRVGVSVEQAEDAKAAFSDSSAQQAQFLSLTASGDRAGAKAYWARIEAAVLAAHTFRRDWVTSTLSELYRTYGVDELNDSLLYAGRMPWWQAGMLEEEKVTDPVARVRQWAYMLSVGVFSTIAVTEREDSFVIHHKVCGSCGRQELDGRYEEPWNFLRVTEDVPGLNFGNPNLTVYRAHVAAIHYVVATETVGHPWPVIDCSGIPGKCWFRIYKDPMQTPEEFYTRAGLKKPS